VEFFTTMDFAHSYLTSQIIAYIGNKRKLLPLIYEALLSIYKEIPSGLQFFDAFSGSGVVSRFGKFLNFRVYSNDWEEYSFIINSAYLEINRRDIPALFASSSQFGDLIETFNNLEDPGPQDQYIAKYYAPASFDIDKVDFRTERLFYTRHNALMIDKIRNKIDELFPPQDTGPENQKKRNLFISLLLYEAATHTNTSGVFKAFHKGFGGHNRDALRRILTPIRLPMPFLIDSDYECKVYKEDTNTVVKNRVMQNIDLAYLDPPYNQHQYGSNYHMLNTITLWDKLPAPLALDDKGRLKEKAAIRKDWVTTKSDYCYRNKASGAFEDLIKNINAKHILISYSTDGIIPFHEMKSICAKKGKATLVTNEYTKYRGGKQSNNRLNSNIEFILIIDTKKKASATSNKEIDAVIKRRELLLLFKKRFSKSKLASHFKIVEANGSLYTELINVNILINTSGFFELMVPEALDELTLEDSELLKKKLSHSLCETREEELHEILLKINGDPSRNSYFIKCIPGTLRKLAHKKNRAIFLHWLGKVKDLQNQHQGLYTIIEEKILALEEQASKRFTH